ncbi:DUF4893 domain-containing protein [Sphingomonas sp.]|jgi:hypothetical protein|uniref:DUF4893 domain-containing protein n=1 Tax=Sphingomonas sp. TaxID=28214 RepID=UPI002E155749|nr:DUF4893 domain-containing protein [Sphingomonas sp.]
MTRTTLLALLAGVALSACARDGLSLVETPPETRWRAVTTDQDRDRLRDWRKAWVAALPAARTADNGVIAREGALFEPDRAMANAMPPAGDYRCRTFKLGARRADLRNFAMLPWARCRIGRDGEMPVFAVLEGDQRPSGTLYAESDARVIFLGALELGDETRALTYSQDRKRDMAGYIERVAIGRWRLVLPYPSFESQIDVIEMVPAG